MTLIQRQNTARVYIEKIRNPVKREYAKQYWLFLKGQVAQPEYSGLSYMAAQAVRLRLSELMATK